MNNGKYYITKGNSMRGMVNELKSLRTDIQESMKSAYPMPYETILRKLNEIIRSISNIVKEETDSNRSEFVKRLMLFRTSLVKSMASTCPMPYSTVIDMLSDIANSEYYAIRPDRDTDVARETEALKIAINSVYGLTAAKTMDIKDPDDTVKRMVDWITELKNVILDSTNAPHPIPYEMIAHELDKMANELRGIIRPGKVSEDTHTNDPVHHPKHYELMPGVEVRDIIRALGNKPSELTGWQEFCRGNVLKYMLRAEDKNGMEDYEKAAVYLGWLLDDYEEDR